MYSKKDTRFEKLYQCSKCGTGIYYSSGCKTLHQDSHKLFSDNIMMNSKSLKKKKKNFSGFNILYDVLLNAQQQLRLMKLSTNFTWNE